jgi:hypothetical protein
VAIATRPQLLNRRIADHEAGVTHAFATPRAVDALALGRLAPRFALHLLEDAPQELLRARGLQLAAPPLERRRGVRNAWSSRHLHQLRIPSGALTYAGSGQLAAGVIDVAARLDDKVTGRQALHDAGVLTPASVVVQSGTVDRDTIADALRSPTLVLQTRHGSGGTGTWTYDAGAPNGVLGGPGGEPLLVSEWLDGPVVNVHLLVEETRCVISAPSVQLLGWLGLAGNPAAYCGADFAAAAALPPAQLDPFLDGAHAVAEHVWSLGFRGLLGLDAILAARPMFLELNPRYQASTWLLAELELAAGYEPVGEAHARALLAPTAVRCASSPQVEVRPVLRGGTLTIRDGGRRLQNDGPTADDRTTVLRPLIGFPAPGEAGVDGLPGPHVRMIGREGVVARVTTREQVLGPDGALSPAGLRLVRRAWALRDGPGPASRTAHGLTRNPPGGCGRC